VARFRDIREHFAQGAASARRCATLDRGIPVKAVAGARAGHLQVLSAVDGG